MLYRGAASFVLRGARRVGYGKESVTDTGSHAMDVPQRLNAVACVAAFALMGAIVLGMI